MDDSFQARQLKDIIRTYQNYRKLADAALAQTPDANLHTLIDPDANSVAVIVKHLAGNLRSRFTEFLTADGEKPTRNRDDEFEMPTAVSREQLLQAWNGAWAVTMGEIERLTPADLERTVYIRKEAFLVLEALNRSVTHLAYHVGQIVLLAKHFQGPNWKSLSIPKGRSADMRHGSFKQGFVPTPPR
jgi:uncharacterized protein DUF1572